MMFHWQDGWTFERLENGAVHIRHEVKGAVFVDLVIPAWHWASIIAAVSPQGETPETWQQARAFHQGE